MVEALIVSTSRKLCLLALLATTFSTSAFAAGPLPAGFSPDDRVVMQGDITFHGASLESAVARGGEIHLELVFTAPSPLPLDIYSFVHFEGQPGCRVVDDRRPPVPVDGVIRHALVVRVPDQDACDGATLELFTGLYNRKTGDRVSPTAPTTMDDRMHAGFVTVLPKGQPSAAARVVLPSDMEGRAFWMRVERLRGELHGYVHVSDVNWSVGREQRGQIVVFLDSRRAELSWTGTSIPTRIEASYLNAWRNFLNLAEAFAGGNTMRVTFPGSRLESWSADLRGTRRVTNVFLDCIRAM